MDTYEATKIVLSRIQSLDPENASRITGYILIQDQGEKEMIRLAFSPESFLLSYVNQAKACLGLPLNSCSTPSTPSSPSPFNNINNPISSSRPNPFSQTSPRIIIPNNNRFHLGANNNPSSPSSPWSSSRSSRSAAAAAASASYAAVVNGGGGGSTNTASGSSSSSHSLPFFNNKTIDLSGDEFGSIQVQDQLSFLDEPLDPIVSPSGRSDSVLFPYGNCEDSAAPQQLHRRSCSVNDVFLGGDDAGGGNGGLGWRPCLYFARGFCKNGSSCKFLHGGGADSVAPDGGGASVGPMVVGSPSKIDGIDELLRLKALQQQRFAAAQQLMASGAPPPFAYNKCMNLLNDNQRSAAATLMMSDEFHHKFGRCRAERSEFSAVGLGGSANSASRQIYLTFPADSTFKEEDVSNYFSMYGPVQDVRIPYQQKRMFGFVTFVYPETVKQILTKGNPHFVCDSRVLVKPYKEKGKVPDKKQHQQHLDRGDFSGCLSPSGLDSREPYDLPFGARMFYNTQEMMLRRKLEQEAELQQAIELQGRRLMNLQIVDLKNHHHAHPFHPGMLQGVALPSPSQSLSQINQDLTLLSDGINVEVPEEVNGSQQPANSPPATTGEQVFHEATEALSSDSGNKEESFNFEKSDPHGSLENILPDNLFASPTKSAAELRSSFATASSAGAEEISPITSSNYIPMLPPTSTLGMASLKSCYFQMPRFSSGQEATVLDRSEGC